MGRPLGAEGLDALGEVAPVGDARQMHRSRGTLAAVPALPPVGRPRYAIPYFMGPHLDTEIACLPTCQGPGNPPRYPPITYATYLDWWYDANYNAARQRDVA